MKYSPNPDIEFEEILSELEKKGFSVLIFSAYKCMF